MMEIPTQNVAAFILDLAARHGVRYEKGPYDDLAEVITRLSDDEVVLDDVDRLLMALARAKVLTVRETIALQMNYHREKFAVPKEK